MKVYLSGEIHTDWRDKIIQGAKGLEISFNAPITNHSASDDCGVDILGPEENRPFQLCGFSLESFSICGA